MEGNSILRSSKGSQDTHKPQISVQSFLSLVSQPQKGEDIFNLVRKNVAGALKAFGKLDNNKMKILIKILEQWRMRHDGPKNKDEMLLSKIFLENLQEIQEEKYGKDIEDHGKEGIHRGIIELFRSILPWNATQSSKQIFKEKDKQSEKLSKKQGLQQQLPQQHQLRQE